VLVSDRHDAIHLCWHSIQMHRDNCFCATRDRRFKIIRVQRASNRVNIDENRRGANVGNGPCSGDEAHRYGYDFVSWTDIETAQSQMQCARAAVQADTMINSAIRCEFALEL
jgi:hypothetical protein